MERKHWAERHPWIFSILLILLILFINGAGVAAAQMMNLPPTTFAAYTEIVLAVVVAIIVTGMRWWRGIGYRRADSARTLLLFLPALVLFIGNLTFGVYVTQPQALLIFAVLAAASGFVEETIFRGLILRSFLPKGAWAAVLISTAIFGVTHLANLLAGQIALETFVQVGYAMAIGFGFGAMALKTGLIWPLAVAHGLGNFVAFINMPPNAELTGGVLTQFLIVTSVYTILFVLYGLYLMLRKEPAAGVISSV